MKRKLKFSQKQPITITARNPPTSHIQIDKRPQIDMEAAEIMKNGIKYMDAAHISAAIIAQCDFFITTDKKLLNYKSDKIEITNPIDFIRMWENEDA